MFSGPTCLYDTNAYTIDYSVEPQIQNGSWKMEILKYRGTGSHAVNKITIKITMVVSDNSSHADSVACSVTGSALSVITKSKMAAAITKFPPLPGLGLA